MAEMRKLFAGYYPRPEKDLEALWERATFVFDANVLLNFYRYSPKTSESLRRSIAHVKPRIWVPYQAAAEFHQNRLPEISRQSAAYEKICKQADNLLSSLDNARSHPFARDATLEPVRSALLTLKTELTTAKEEQLALVQGDTILERITDLLGNHVGDPPSEEEYVGMLKLAETRITKHIPPGYKDAKKDGPRKCGDGVMWLEILAFAKQTKVDVILVTDDSKEDWWLGEAGKTLGPRPELVREFREQASRDFHMYDPTRFITFATKAMGRAADEGTLREVREVSKRRRARRRIRETDHSSISYMLDIAEHADRHRKECTEFLNAAESFPNGLWKTMDSPLELPPKLASQLANAVGKCRCITGIAHQIDEISAPGWHACIDEVERIEPAGARLLTRFRHLAPEAMLIAASLATASRDHGEVDERD